MHLTLMAPAVVPAAIEIGYNETVKLDIGMWDTKTNSGFEVQVKPVRIEIFNRRIVDFKVIEYPGGSNDHGSWFITFNPFTIDITKGTLMKSTASISLTSPPSASNPIQSGILKIRVFDTWAFKGLFFPPRGHSWRVPVRKWFWLLGSTITVKYGFKLSGTVQTRYEDIDILVKVKPYHALRFDTLPLIRLNPDQITSIPVRLQNLGNYNDTYSFRIVNKNNDIKLTTPYSITLAPGEIKNTYLGVSAPQNIFDYGTIHHITVEAYSINDPNVTIAKRTIYIESRGIYISEIVGSSFIIIAIIIILGFAIISHRRRIFLNKYCKKPDKPWEIPKEKKYLDKLKKSDETKYNEVSKMMQDEYNSALLWYKYYCNTIVKKKEAPRRKIEIRSGLNRLFKKLTKINKLRQEGKKEKIKVKKEKFRFKKQKPLEKPVKEPKKIKKVKPEKIKKVEKKVDKKAELERSRRERVISKIRYEQEKQLRKIKG